MLVLLCMVVICRLGSYWFCCVWKLSVGRGRIGSAVYGSYLSVGVVLVLLCMVVICR